MIKMNWKRMWVSDWSSLGGMCQRLLRVVWTNLTLISPFNRWRSLWPQVKPHWRLTCCLSLMLHLPGMDVSWLDGPVPACTLEGGAKWGPGSQQVEKKGPRGSPQAILKPNQEQGYRNSSQIFFELTKNLTAPPKTNNTRLSSISHTSPSTCKRWHGFFFGAVSDICPFHRSNAKANICTEPTIYPIYLACERPYIMDACMPRPAWGLLSKAELGI